MDGPSTSNKYCWCRNQIYVAHEAQRALSVMPFSELFGWRKMIPPPPNTITHVPVGLADLCYGSDGLRVVEWPSDRHACEQHGAEYERPRKQVSGGRFYVKVFRLAAGCFNYVRVRPWQ